MSRYVHVKNQPCARYFRDVMLALLLGGHTVKNDNSQCLLNTLNNCESLFLTAWMFLTSCKCKKFLEI